MTSGFLNTISIVIGSRGESDNATVECQSNINHYKYNQFALIPAVLITLSFAVTKNRRNILLSLWKGRPGLIFPMDTLTRSSRISYACAFGATAFLVYEIVLEQKAAIQYDGGNRAVKSFVAMGSMFIYGMVFFPLFTSLAIGSVYGYAMGSLYVWMLTTIQIYRVFECESASLEAKGLTLLRILPSVLCLLYLSVSIPIRVVIAFRHGHYFTWRDDGEVTNTLSDIRTSYAGHYVTKLFKKPKMKLPAETKKDHILGILLSLAHRFIYQRKRGFRYPARILSILFTAVIVIYMLTFEVLMLFPMVIQSYIDGVSVYLTYTIGWEQAANESTTITDQRDFFIMTIWFMDVIRICIIVSAVLATVVSLFNVLHTLSYYRANLLALYRGDHSHIPPASRYSNISHCISSIKYAGFQVGYIIWGYVIQLCILLLLSFLCAVFITLIKYDFTWWLIFLLELIWPVLLTIVLVMVVQYLMSRFVFLQERGQLLALDNRSMYFNFTYFMFFYNIFLGLASCLIRILKAMLLGIVFLSRLDNSTLSRRFEFFDPGFRAYIGYMHLEAEHTHPVMIVFCRLMLLGLTDKRRREEEKLNRKNGCYGDGGYDIPLGTPTPKIKDAGDEESRRRVAARFNWHVTYTLLHNPDIRVMRKGFLQMLRQAQLMGVYIPVSDRQADVNIEQLQECLAEAKEKLNPSSKKTKEGENVDVDKEALKEVLTGGEKDDVKKAMSTSSVGNLAAQVTGLSAAAPPEGSSPHDIIKIKI